MIELADIDHVRSLRLHSQRITADGRPDDQSARDVVQHLLAVQAQDLSAAFWAVGARSTLQRGDVIAALDMGSVVRSMPVRGTLHLVAANDLPWMLSLTAERTLQSAASRRAALGIDGAVIDRAAAALVDALSGGRSLERSAALAVFDQAGLRTDGGRGYHLLFHLQQVGLVCWGPTIAAPRPSAAPQQALVLVDEWVREPRVLDRDQALAELALRYVHGHGPVSDRDLAWWAKITLRDARAAIESVRDRLVEVVFDGRTLFASRASVESWSGDGASGAHVLPGFDHWLLGYERRHDHVDDDYADRVMQLANAVFRPLVVVDGRVVGTWRDDSGHAELDLFEAVAPERLDAALSRYASF